MSQTDDQQAEHFTAQLELFGSDAGVVTGTTTYNLGSDTCAGEVSMRSVTSSEMRLDEQITAGPCVPTGAITVIIVTEDSLSFEYRGVKKDGVLQIVRGVLTKQEV